MKGMECPPGIKDGLPTSSITDECECRKAADALRRTFNSVGCHKTEKPGCFQKDKQFFFSICAKSPYQAGHNSAVCKRKCFNITLQFNRSIKMITRVQRKIRSTHSFNRQILRC